MAGQLFGDTSWDAPSIRITPTSCSSPLGRCSFLPLQQRWLLFIPLQFILLVVYRFSTRHQPMDPQIMAALLLQHHPTKNKTRKPTQIHGPTRPTPDYPTRGATPDRWYPTGSDVGTNDGASAIVSSWRAWSRGARSPRGPRSWCG